MHITSSLSIVLLTRAVGAASIEATSTSSCNAVTTETITLTTGPTGVCSSRCALDALDAVSTAAAYADQVFTSILNQAEAANSTSFAPSPQVSGALRNSSLSFGSVAGASFEDCVLSLPSLEGSVDQLIADLTVYIPRIADSKLQGTINDDLFNEISTYLFFVVPSVSEIVISTNNAAQGTNNCLDCLTLASFNQLIYDLNNAVSVFNQNVTGDIPFVSYLNGDSCQIVTTISSNCSLTSTSSSLVMSVFSGSTLPSTSWSTLTGNLSTDSSARLSSHIVYDSTFLSTPSSSISSQTVSHLTSFSAYSSTSSSLTVSDYTSSINSSRSDSFTNTSFTTSGTSTIKAPTVVSTAVNTPSVSQSLTSYSTPVSFSNSGFASEIQQVSFLASVLALLVENWSVGNYSEHGIYARGTGIQGVLQIQDSYSPLSSAVAALASASFDKADVHAQIGNLNNMMGSIVNLLDDLSEKASNFEAVGILNVEDDINGISDTSGAFISRLLEVDSDCVDIFLLVSEIQSLSTAFNSARKLYNASAFMLPAFTCSSSSRFNATSSFAMPSASASSKRSSHSAVSTDAENDSGTTTTITSIVSEYTTYCPSATTFTEGSKTYTVTEPTTLTISNCPCTRTEVRIASSRPTSDTVYSESAGTITTVVSEYTTFCPNATTFIEGSKTYTATGPTTLTVSNCPCTRTSVISRSIEATDNLNSQIMSSTAYSNMGAASTISSVVSPGTPTSRTSDVATANRGNDLSERTVALMIAIAALAL